MFVGKENFTVQPPSYFKYKVKNNFKKSGLLIV